MRDLNDADTGYEVRWARFCVYRPRSPGQVPPKMGSGRSVLTQFSLMLGVVLRKGVATRDIINAAGEYEVRLVRLCV